VINRGNSRQQVFHKDAEYRAFTGLMGEAKKRHMVKVHAYCLMPNHFHLLLKPEQGDELSRWMQWLMTSHVRRYHKHYGTSGHVWQGRFKSFIIAEDAHLLTVARYIEGNPVRACLVASAREWSWSSHAGRCESGVDVLLDPLPLALPMDWTDYVDKPITESELERVRSSVNRQTPFGNVQWQQRVCAELGLESTMRTQGRPKKRAEK
jgi:putative transposase